MYDGIRRSCPQEVLKTNRIQRVKAALFQKHREISLERALLY
ncbi:hypothetical protein, partial [Salmonella enterica]